MHDSKVTGRVDLMETHVSRDAGRQVHRSVRNSKDEVSPEVQTVAASTATVLLVRRANAALNEKASHAVPRAVGSSENVLLVRRVGVNLNENVLLVLRVGAVLIATVSLGRPIIEGSIATVTRVAPNVSATGATALPVLREGPEWTAIDSPARHADVAPNEIASLVRPSVVISMAIVPIILRLIRV